MWSYITDPWKTFTDYVLSPRVDQDEVQEELKKHRAALPKPVIWLLGKTQAGKSSIVRALTGSTAADIGSGFAPCTRTAQLYAFPDPENCILQFLDTRGLGEAGYDPTEDLNVCKGQAHLLMLVVKATDQANKVLIDAARKVREAKPGWPIIVVQTTLHQGYGGPGVPHVIPYPYGDDPWPDTIPVDLARALRHQREEFADLATSFVAVDFTLPEDGMEPADYGLEALWSAIESAFPHGLRELIHADPKLRDALGDIYYAAAWPHVLGYAAAAGAAGAVPIPLVDIPAVLAIQAKMFHAIASIYQQPLSGQLMKEFGAAVGTTLAGQFGRSVLRKFIPIFGSVVGAVYNAATTYALGCALCWYFAEIRKGAMPTSDQLKKVFEDELAQGRKRFEGMFKTVKPAPQEPATA